MFAFFNKGIKASLLAGALAAVPTVANASTMLKADDFVGISFWTISMAMVAATVFFLMEAGRMSGKWKTSLTVGALVTLVAAVHYFYMRDVWASGGGTPTVYRYVDWLITVPLQVSEFYLILAAVGVATAALFWRLLGASLVMLITGFLAESGQMDDGLTWPLFGVGMLAWIYIMYEIWAGEAKEKVSETSEGTQFAFKAMAIILTVGWAIYPLGWILGQDAGDTGIDRLNILYNIADVVNKTAFGMMVWYAATMDTKASSSEE